MIALETQEAGTGKWFAVITYHPGTDEQRDRAVEAAEVLRHIGMYAQVTRDKPEEKI